MRVGPAILAFAFAFAAFASGAVAQDEGERRLSTPELSLCEPPQGPVARPDGCTWPQEVRLYTQRRDECDHWRSEPVPEDIDPRLAADRRKQIEQAVAELCPGADAQLLELKRKYRSDASVMQALNGYEVDIEP